MAIVTTGMHLDQRYGLLTVGLLGTIWGLSSVPYLSDTGDRLVGIASNVSHAPLFAALTFCWFKTVAGGPAVSWPGFGTAFLAATVSAVLDEWHQSFVPGRYASINDLLVDAVGIGGMLVALGVTAAYRARTRLT